MEEKYLIHRAQAGDIDAFESLARQYQNKIYALALRMIQNQQDALDVSQNVLIKIYRKIHLFRGQSSFATWVYRIAKNACLDFLRAQKKSVSLEELSESGYEIQSFTQKDDPEKSFEAKEQTQKLIALVMALPEAQRRLIVLRDIEGYSYEEIGDLLSLQPGTVKSRLFRARNRLRKMLAGE